MLLTVAQIEKELVHFGLISPGDPIQGVEGIAKNLAITLSSAFSFRGERAVAGQMFAFPRKGINDEYPESFLGNGYI